MLRFLLLFLIAVFLVAGGPAGAETFEDGLRLYRAGDYKGAMDVWLPLAEAGDRDAQYRFGGVFRDGKGVAQDNAVAAEWFVKAALQGQAEAQTELGYMFSQGDGLPRDRAKAKCWYLLAARQGNPLAQNNLANFLKRSEDPFYWRYRAARQGHTAAMAVVGWVHWQNPFQHDKTEGFMYLVLAAERGDPDAQNDLAKVRADQSPEARYALSVAEAKARAWQPMVEEPPSMPPPVPDVCLP